MAGFLLWFPGKSGISNDALAAVGLADLARDKGPEWVPLDRGPDGRAGQLALWRTGDAGSDPPPALLPTQDWQPCLARPAKGIAKGAYWLGLDRKRPLAPADIQRTKLHPGYWLKLGDGQEWHIPTANMLPHVHGVGEQGYERQVAPAFADFWERSRSFAEQIFTALGQLELLQQLHGGRAPQKITVELNTEDLFRLGVEALALNYRMWDELATRLRLFDDDALRNIPMLVVDLPVLARHHEKKKRAAVDLDRRWVEHQLWRRGVPRPGPDVGRHLLALER